MTDVFTPAERSRIMARIGSTGTRPELALQKALRRAGLRTFGTNVRSIPGSPDIVFRRARLAVFVDGAFWHGHSKRIRPGRSSFWDAKIAGNVARDARVRRRLRREGWSVIRLWDFKVVRDPDAAAQRVLRRVASARMQPSSH